MRRRVAALSAALVGAGLALAAGVGLYLHEVGPEGHLLVASSGVPWIREPGPPSILKRVSETRVFRRQLVLALAPKGAPVSLESFGTHTLIVNGRTLPGPPGQATPRQARELDLAPHLVGGANEITVQVTNDRGPPALWVRAVAVDLSTDRRWEVSADGTLWEPAALAGERLPVPLFPTLNVWEQLPHALPLWFGLFAIGAGAWMGVQRHGDRLPARVRALLEPGALRWLALAAWGVLAANAVARLPTYVGLDAPHHYEYVLYVLEHRRVPFADEGGQLFQSPLFYVLAAPLYHVLWSVFGDAVAALVRVLPMACGLAQIELCYRAARRVFPERPALQGLTLLVGGFLPVSVHVSQSVGNEPLSGLLTAAAVLLCLRLLSDASLSLRRASLGLGVLLGLALLTKVSAFVLVPLFVVVLLAVARERGRRPHQAVGIVLGTAAVSAGLAGWYYVRNWLRFGQPFVGGWDPLHGPRWWQDPGYRVPADYLSFGRSLSEPIYAGMFGIWDGLYSTLWLDGNLSGVIPIPPWNYGLMVPMALLSLPMQLAFFAGVARALRAPADPSRRLELFCVAAVASFVGALLLHFTGHPSYVSAKSSYALGVLPCFAILVASGLDLVLRGVVARAATAGYVSAWLGSAYLSFFVR